MNGRLMLVAVGAAITFGTPQARAGDVAAGEARFAETCRNCHGPKGQGMSAYPAVAGLDPEATTDLLERYRAGERIGPNAPLMIPMATDLTDEEIANLAAFIATLD
jgi:cytochrome c553